MAAIWHCLGAANREATPVRRSLVLAVAATVLAATGGSAALGATLLHPFTAGQATTMQLRSATTPNAITARLLVDKATYTGACPVVLHFTARVFAPRAGSIFFHFVHSPGKAGPQQRLDFVAKGTRSVYEEWQFTQSLVGAVGFSMAPVPETKTPEIAPTDAVNVKVHCT
jgi:hypothetical protein